MEHHRNSIRIGAVAILAAVALRILSSGILQPLLVWLSQPNTQSFLIYLETGRNVRFSPSLEENADHAAESPPPSVSGTSAPVTFTAEDLALVNVKYGCGYTPDLEALLLEPLQWDLTGSEPTVLIIHTHATESYTKSPGEIYEETSAFRTLNESYNMLSVGDRLAELLEAGGITVIHDRELHDYPSYNGSYAHSREAVSQWLREYPSIRLVLDLHRDASGDLSNQLRTAVTVDGEDCAQLMLVMGTNASGQSHSNWQENLALGLKLNVVLERQTPGITRPMSLRSTRFNQDLSPGALLIEVGAAGNSHPEALRAAEKLADAILTLADGTEG